jgi:proliferating cell nuclear antigen
MFHARVKSKVLRDIVNVVSTLVDQARLDIDKEGIGLKAVDPFHVAMMEMRLRRAVFEEFAADEMILGLDIRKLKEALRFSPAEDLIGLEHDPAKDRLQIRIGNITKCIGMVDPTRFTDFMVPRLSPPARIVIAARELQTGIRAAQTVSDNITLNATPDAFEITSVNETDSISYKMPKSLLVSLDCSEKVRSQFGLEFLSDTVRFLSPELNVAVNIGNDYPVKLEVGGLNRAGYIGYLIAPRVESD